LVGIAYERELNRALEDLFSRFEKWKKGEIDAFDLDKEIHIHHNGISRDLFKIYRDRDLQLSVYLAFKRGIIKMDEINVDCRPLFEKILES